jgi:hypothetical protein
MPFYFENSSLIQITSENVYAYVYDHKIETHFVKIFSKRTGQVKCLIKLEKSTRFHHIKVDYFSCLIIKEKSDLMKSDRFKIKYLDSNGKLLCQTQDNYFQNFKSIELTQQDELFYLDQNKKLFIC